MPFDDIPEPFTLPENPPKDIVINEFNQEIIIKNHFSSFIVWGPFLLLIGIPIICLLLNDSEPYDFESIIMLIFWIAITGFGLVALCLEIRNQLINIKLSVDNDMLRIKFSNKDQIIELQRDLNLDLLVDGIEVVNGAPPTHRIIVRLAHEGEIFVNFGTLSKNQYLWLKELFKAFFTLTIVYENKQLAQMQL